MSRDAQNYSLRFEVLMVVKMSMAVFWHVVPCGLVGGHQRFGGTYDPEDGGDMFH
jgi:hypothetical protein